MTAAGLIVLSVACLIIAVAGAILVTYLDIRAERKWRHWDSMPGATSADDEPGGDLLTLATKWARDDWDEPVREDRIKVESEWPWSRKA